jgi:amidase
MRSVCASGRGGTMPGAEQPARRPLHGLPVTVKSSIATRGLSKCEIGSLLHKGDVPREDAVVVARLRAAGALILGTTNCPEFLMAYETANLLHGRTRKSRGTWSGRRADRAAASRRPLRRECRRRAGQRQRRIGARARALYRHLLAEADAGADSRARASAAQRGAVLNPGRNWADGADDGDVALLFRTLSGQDPHDPASPPVDLRERSLEETADKYDWIL